MSKNPQNRSKNSSPFLKKFQIYEMALNGKRRPEGKSLRDVLAKYVSHDPEFASEIKSLAPHWWGGKKADAKKTEFVPKDAPSFELVIQRMTNALRNPGNPALKAHATRALTKYAANRAVEIGSTPTRVMAGVRASFTKRMAKA
jgi:hypothetical protein